MSKLTLRNPVKGMSSGPEALGRRQQLQGGSKDTFLHTVLG